MRPFFLFLLLAINSASAQYRTESWDLKSGWTAIYLNVDPGLTPLSTLMAANPDVTDVWKWLPNGLDPTLNATDAEPGAGEWKVWRRNDTANSNFAIMTPHTAYLVKMKTGSPLQKLRIKGKVLAPRVEWRTDGSNLVGFPIKSDTTPQLNRYLGGAGVIDNNTEAYRFVGGAFSESNPMLSPARLINARRGEAFWIRSNKFTDFYGPIQVRAALDDGLDFGTSGSPKRLVLTNQTAAAVEVTLEPTPSEAPPETTLAPPSPSLMLRSRNSDGLDIYTPLGASHVVTVPANDSVGLFLGVDRTSMVGEPGQEFAGLLRVTDGGGLSEIFFPITAEKSSLAGLWVGEAVISQVQNQLQRFQREADGSYSVGEDGGYIPLSSETGLNETAQEFRMRLIMHMGAAGKLTLLSQVFAGVIGDDGEGNLLVGLSTEESTLLAEHLETAVRMTTAAFPTDLIEEMSGSLAAGSTVSATVDLGANASSNPFIHTYHPDHDNKDARFENILPPGIESHRVIRNITLTLNSEGGPGEGADWGTSLFSGTFSETVTGIHKQPIAASGIFAIRKVSDIAILETP